MRLAFGIAVTRRFALFLIFASQSFSTLTFLKFITIAMKILVRGAEGVSFFCLMSIDTRQFDTVHI